VVWTAPLKAGQESAGLVAFALHAFAHQLAVTAHGFGRDAGLLFGRLFISAAQLHLPENPFALQLFLKRAQGLIDIVVANDDLNDFSTLLHRTGPPRGLEYLMVAVSNTVNGLLGSLSRRFYDVFYIGQRHENAFTGAIGLPILGLWPFLK